MITICIVFSVSVCRACIDSNWSIVIDATKCRGARERGAKWGERDLCGVLVTLTTLTTVQAGATGT